ATMRMAFWAASPTSTTKPIWVRMLMSCPMMRTPMVAASRHIGTIRMTANGRLHEPYCAASTRNTDARRERAPGAILRRHHQEHEQHADREHVEAGIAAGDLLVRKVGPFE